jgi:uncharacterized membrane protein YdbT with pleckstrin-like domain
VGFPRRLQHEAEEVVLVGRPHWWAVTPPLAALAAAVAVLVTVAVGGAPDWAVLGLALLTLVVLGRLVARSLRWFGTWHVVTSERLVCRTGVLGRRATEVPLELVDALSLDQTLLQRLVGTGDLVVESAGERRRAVFTTVARPSTVQRAVARQVGRRPSRPARSGGG